MAAYDRSRLLARLNTLPKPSGKSLPNSIVYGIQVGGQPGWQLAELDRIPGEYVRVDKTSVSLMMNQAARRKMMTFKDEAEGGFAKTLNDQLLGGKDYPILKGVLGIGVGLLSGGAGIAFSLVTLGIDQGKRTNRILVRDRDELWQTELIGKVKSGSGFDIQHVSYFWVVDPFRRDERSGSNDPGFAWIIHEDRASLHLKFT